MKKSNLKSSRGYVIGVDGGGAKTVAALADLEGKILKLVKTGSSHPRNIGFKKAIENLAQTIEKTLPSKRNKRILSTFLGLPAMEEEFKFKKGKIKRELLKHKEISQIFKGKVILDSDQLAGFRAGTNKKDGLVLIAGSGCAVHGWREKREAKIDGWGYLTEQGSAFWVGQRGLREVFNDLDGRGVRTLITKLVFQKLKVRNKENLVEKIYSKKPMEIISPLSILVDKAAKKGDLLAKKILIEAGKELALSANTVIKKLTPPFAKQRAGFPVVLIGGMFKSKIFLNTVKKEVKKLAPKVKFIQPKDEPAIGAVKLALEKLDSLSPSNKYHGII